MEAVDGAQKERVVPKKSVKRVGGRVSGYCATEFVMYDLNIARDNLIRVLSIVPPWEEAKGIDF